MPNQADQPVQESRPDARPEREPVSTLKRFIVIIASILLSGVTHRQVGAKGS